MKRNLLHRLLENPWVYTLSQQLWYRKGQQQAYIDAWVRPRAGDHILDIGCGPGKILERLPPVHYVGYEPNAHYVEQAVARFGAQGTFRNEQLTQLPVEERQTFDIVLANGVIHHLSDEQSNRLMSVAWEALKTGGRIITRDGCFEERQGRFARWLLRHDRGSFVRTQENYQALFGERFDIVRTEILLDALRLPYSLIHFEAVKRV